MSLEEEERIHTDPQLIVEVREKLLDYLKKIVESKWYRSIVDGDYTLVSKKGVLREQYSGFNRIGVVDGGSNTISLSAGYIGIAASVGLVIEGNRVVEKTVGEPEIVPSDPSELAYYETIDKINSVLDKLREAKVFETASKLLDRGVDLLIIDGPLIPYGALAKRIVLTSSEEEAWRRYREAVFNLHRISLDREVSVIGFVKRPRSQFLCRMVLGLHCYDHVLLSKILNAGEYYPDPPDEAPSTPEYIHEDEVREIVSAVKPRYTYVRLTSSTPPYRVDFGSLNRDYHDVLNLLYSSRTREGIPFMVMKVDEETKITNKLLRELYSDLIHEFIFKYMGRDFSRLAPILPEYGGV